MNRSLVAAMVLSFASITPAFAVCDASSLRGNWRFYEYFGVHDEQGFSLFSFVEKCGVGISTEGLVQSAPCFDIPSQMQYDLDWLNRSADIRSNCIFTIETEFCLYHGTIESDRRTASGIGYCSGFDVLTFDLVRQ